MKYWMEKQIHRNKSRVFLGALIACVMMGGCGSGGDGSASSQSSKSETYEMGGYGYVTENTSVSGEAASDSAAAEEPVLKTELQESSAEPLEENAQTARKLIKTVDLCVETENYDTLIQNLGQQIAALGGYVEYQHQYNGSSYSSYQETRNTNMTVRIPVEHLDEFIVTVGEWTNITNKEERVEDVTLQYVDLESHKKALLTEQDRLLELLGQAESVEDVIAIEQRLSQVRYELESMESQLRTLDNQIDYSTVYLSIEEVKRLTPTQENSVWDRMKNGFGKTIYQIGDGFEDGVIWFVVNIPYFVIWIIVFALTFFLARTIVRKRRRKAEGLQQLNGYQWEENAKDKEAGANAEEALEQVEQEKGSEE